MGVATYIKDEKDAIKEVILQSGIKVKPVYTPEDLERVGFDYAKDLGDAGEFPFTQEHTSFRIQEPKLDNQAVHRIRHS